MLLKVIKMVFRDNLLGKYTKINTRWRKDDINLHYQGRSFIYRIPISRQYNFFFFLREGRGRESQACSMPGVEPKSGSYKPRIMT